MGRPYDLKLTDEQGEMQLVADWGQQNPIRIVHQKSDDEVQSVQLTSDQPWVNRSPGPPFPIFMDSFANGQGQLTYDSPKAAYDGYDYAERLDLNTPGLIKLGPRATFARFDGVPVTYTGFGDTTPPTMRGPAFAHGGNIYVTCSGTSNQIRRLITGTSTIGATGWLDGYEGSTEMTMWVDAANGATQGSFVRSRNTGNVWLIHSIISSVSWRVKLLDGDPTIAESGGLLDSWTLSPVTFTSGAPADLVRSFTTDGAVVYACSSDSYADGQVLYGNGGSGWLEWAAVTGMLHLCHSGGVLYGAKATSATTVELGYFGASKAWVPFAITGLLNPAATVVGMCASNLYVYAALTDNYNSSYLMRMRHDVADTYNQVAEFPDGFVATCIYGANGIVYVGGYRETGDLDLENGALVEGLVYAVIGDSNVVRVAVMNQEAGRDMRVLSIGSRGTNLLFATTQDVFRYNLETGALSHYADITTGSLIEGGASATIAWDDNGWGADYGSTRYPEDVSWTEMSSTSTISFLYRDLTWDQLTVVCDAKKYHGWYRTEGTSVNRTFEVLMGDGAMDPTNGYMRSQAGMISLSNPTKLGAVRIEAKLSGTTRTSYTLQVGKWVSGAWVWDSYQKTGIDKLSMLKVRLTIDASYFKVYLNDSLLFSLPVAELAPTSSGRYAANTMQFAAGWWWNPTTDTVAERGTFTYAIYSTAGAYPPNWVGAPSSVSYVSSVLISGGKTFIPVPSKGVNVIEPDKTPVVPGYVRTSATTLREGAAKKSFAHADVIHDGIHDGQSITLGVITENGAVPVNAGEVVDESTMRFRLGVTARRVALQLNLSDSEVSRPPAQALKVRGISLYYMPEEKNPAYEFTLSVTEKTQGLIGDPSDIIDRLLALVGKTVPASSLYGDFDAYVEQADYVPVPSSGDYPSKQGRIKLLLRNLA